MTRRSIDHGAVGNVLAIVDHDRPDLDESEESDVCELLKREDEGEEVVRHALAETVHRVEGVAGVGCRHDPFVVRFVQGFVDVGVVQATMDPVDAAVGEQEEERELEVVVGPAKEPDCWVRGYVCEGVVDEAVASDFGDEGGEGEDGHPWY